MQNAENAQEHLRPRTSPSSFRKHSPGAAIFSTLTRPDGAPHGTPRHVRHAAARCGTPRHAAPHAAAPPSAAARRAPRGGVLGRRAARWIEPMAHPAQRLTLRRLRAHRSHAAVEGPVGGGRDRLDLALLRRIGSVCRLLAVRQRHLPVRLALGVGGVRGQVVGLDGTLRAALAARVEDLALEPRPLSDAPTPLSIRVGVRRRGGCRARCPLASPRRRRARAR